MLISFKLPRSNTNGRSSLAPPEKSSGKFFVFSFGSTACTIESATLPMLSVCCFFFFFFLSSATISVTYTSYV